MIAINYLLITTVSVKIINSIDYLGLAKSALWYIAKAASNALLLDKQKLYQEKLFYIKYGDMGASVKMSINVGHSNMRSMCTNNYTKQYSKISVILTTFNRTDVINRAVTHGQMSFYL